MCRIVAETEFRKTNQCVIQVGEMLFWFDADSKKHFETSEIVYFKEICIAQNSIKTHSFHEIRFSKCMKILTFKRFGMTTAFGQRPRYCPYYDPFCHEKLKVKNTRNCSFRSKIQEDIRLSGISDILFI